MRKFTRLFLFSLAVLLLSPSAGAVASSTSSIRLRVSVIDNKEKISLVLKGPYKIYAVDSDRVVKEGPRLRANLSAAKGGILIGEREIKLRGLKIKTSKDSNIYISGRRFRGDIDIIRKDDGGLMVINNIDMEDYLYGVLSQEVSHRWSMESLKAQAIAARTFALYQKTQNKLHSYDLRSDIYSQVYGGRNPERWATTKAVSVTKDKVLIFNGRVFPAYYHATCAGHTEDASNLWNINLEPLKGLACDFCKRSPHYYWSKEISLWALQDKLKISGYAIGKISSLTLLSQNPSGRVKKIEIKDEADVTIIMTAKDFRQMIGPNELRSTRFECSIKWNKLMVRGSGWGHGAGMCQWGAYGMARKGKRAEEILKYYYPGAEITTIDKLTDKL